jgi:quinol monooxygenase YgiN
MSANDGDLYDRMSAAAESHQAKDDRPTSVIFRFRVDDFDHWRAGYEKAVATDSLLLSYRIWRGQDDPDLVVLQETFGSRSYPEESLQSAAVKEAMASDGIDMSSVQVDFVDEAGSWTH